ncbi:MAG: FadR family transcriptional regulator [Rhodospirillales bacterium]|nr:FadR family transcriptional regulator [Rhodospirillales bacterium]
MTSEGELRTLNHLRRIIQLGHYPEGSRLPTERELAAELSLGRGPIRRALAALESEGRISRHIGRGTFVGSRPGPTRGEPFSQLTGSASPGDIMETRLTIEPRIAAMAAVRASEEDINYLRICVTKSELADTWAAWDRWDATFHRTIAMVSRNAMLADLIELINKARRSQFGSRVRKAPAGSDWRTLLILQHRKIAESIAARDPQAAAMAMRKHLNSVEERIFGDPDELANFTEQL